MYNLLNINRLQVVTLDDAGSGLCGPRNRDQGSFPPQLPGLGPAFHYSPFSIHYSGGACGVGQSGFKWGHGCGG